MNKRIKKALRSALLFLCVVVFVLSTGKLIYSLYSGYKIQKEATKLESQIFEKNSYTTIDKAGINFKKLKEINPDAIAWIQIPNTTISHPVVYRVNDNSTYLTKDFNGNESVYGAIFLDGKNSSDFKDKVSFIFGHNVSTTLTLGEKTYFTGLYEYYKNPEYIKTHDKVLLNTPEENYEYTVLGAIHVNEFTKLYKTNFSSTDEFNSYLNMLSSSLNIDKSIFNDNTKLLVLSTCFEAVENTEDRLLLFAYKND